MMTKSAVKNTEFIVFIKEVDDNLKITIIDPVKEKLVCEELVSKDNFKDFFEEELIKLQQKLKVVFFLLPKCSYEFCKEAKALFNSIYIPTYFFYDVQLYLAFMLISAEHVSKIGETVVFITAFESEAKVYGYKFTKNGYLQRWILQVKIDDNKSDENIRTEILNNCNPNAFFIHANPANVIRLKEIFKDVKKVFTFESSENNWNPAEMKNVIEYSKWFFDKTYIKYFVQPVSDSEVELNRESRDVKYPVVTVAVNDPLPICHTVVVKKIVNTCSISVQKLSDVNATILETWLPDQNAHQHEAILSVDEEGFIDYQIKPILLPQIKNLPTWLTKNFKSGIPVIAFFENLSFICVHPDGKTEYEFLGSWNGNYIYFYNI
uniref:Uncharacterized protein n=1 Tax=Panagrolaimus davidi TaxID=227884 RepID=A0A914PDD1_9BILA